MNIDKHAKLFDNIAFIYNWFFKFQVRYYTEIIERNFQSLGLDRNASGLDIGCGTGAFSYSLNKYGFKMQGIDISGKMIRHAEKKELTCIKGDASGQLPFKDNQFDFTCMAYVAHGLKNPLRDKLFAEARRVSKNTVLIHDYNTNRRILTDFVEYMEGGDYFNFTENGFDEMKMIFKQVDKIDVGPQAAWYICRKK